jgi:hypothetical protein
MAWLDAGELKDIDLAEQFRAVIHRLEESYEYEFVGLKTGEDGHLYAKRRDIVCPGCANWVVMIPFGMVPDYLTSIEHSIRWVEESARLRDLKPLLVECHKRINERLNIEPEPDEETKEIERHLARKEAAALEQLRTVN